MDAEAWTLVLGIVALALNIAAFAVGYGVLKGQVTALAARVHALEGEMSALTDLKVEVAKISARQETWIEQLRELNASIRWMRAPADYEGDAPAPKQRGGR